MDSRQRKVRVVTRLKMFETIFIPSAASKHRMAPLLREREEFLSYLKNRGTGWSCLRVYASRLNQIVRFLRLTKFRVVRPIEIKKAARRWATYHGEYRYSSETPGATLTRSRLCHGVAQTGRFSQR